MLTPASCRRPLQYYGERGQLDATPVPSALERDKDPRLAASPLRFPGGWALLASAPGAPARNLQLKECLDTALRRLPLVLREQPCAQLPGVAHWPTSRSCSLPPRPPAGKVATDLAGNRLFIADSSNNRIVVTDLQGKFLEQVRRAL